MALSVTVEDEESLRQQCENASLEDTSQTTKKMEQKAVLPPIKLGMSFSDWKQMKEAGEDNNSRSAKVVKPTGLLRQNRHNNNSSSEHSQQRRPQQQNLPNFNAFPKRQNQRSDRNFFQDPMIPPIMSPSSYDDHQWSSGPLMQPMFPPMPRMPRLNQYSIRINQSGQYNNRFPLEIRTLTRVKPKSGQMNSTASQKEQKPNSIKTATTADTKISIQENRTQPQIYVQRPRNAMNKNDKLKSNWIIKPQAPPPMQANTPELREEKQRMWREYRQAMKPFKNREFSNAKRVVQRLGKKNYEELDEKDRSRLDRAWEAVNAHKDMLNARVEQRSTRIEQQLKTGTTETSNGPTTNGVEPLTSWHLNTSSYTTIWNSGGTQNAPHSFRHVPLMGSFVPAHLWNTTPVLTNPRS
ncbi:uncharacterized protein LOC129247186 [Anastrepha obliqua]|uniref:uncharacterized protein LOC129247186 n=1 Tax=Anastrepha obliqua TaxID=95512 RepID=UPI002409E771|nr:uncharacterized protein LOC129247186 [Anastrepha obliqua]